jgi:hypothetical protein
MGRPNYAFAKRQKELAKKKKKEEKRQRKLEKKAEIDAANAPALPVDPNAPPPAPAESTPAEPTTTD